ncbi:MAG: radical SAM protein [Candidatus Methanoperedens sp.]|nr:radical SAM protein [Candidatus Methanoperedens sp. BLZ2]MBZ0174694.1 radical SAM protein [Candidatus Methanoperedens nitroreducens]MCX9078390.1 radical SAM protein [Candidatus Methanoperedens sp.]
MSLIYRRKANQPSISHVIYDYLGEIRPFAKRIEKKHLILPLVFLKTIEWSIYRWYKTPIRRFYGVKGNELIYMITRRCNERCLKCGIWKNPEPDSEHLKISDFINCLKSLHHNLYQVTLTGGEPLLFMEDVLQIAEVSKKLNVPMITVTNGSLINEDFLNRYSKLDHILVISIDTLDKEKWSEFRGRDNFDAVMNNLQIAKKMLGDKLRIQSVLAHETINDIPKIIAFCKDVGILHVSQPYMDFGGIWQEAKQISENKNDIVCAARKNICIYPNGDVVKCFDHYRIPIAKEPLGNIGREDIIPILCKKRSTEISKIMKNCNYPCKNLSCNIPALVYNT